MQTWHIITITISSVNLLLALFLFFRSFKWKAEEPQNAQYFLLLRSMGLIFVSIALYRSVFVSSYPDRLVWFDTLLNSPFLIRCLAVFAEISHIGLIAVVLINMNRDMPLSGNGKNSGLLHNALNKLPFIAIGCIFFAQFFAFGGLITQFLWPFAIEETLWALAFISVTPVVVSGLARLKKEKQKEKSLKFFLVILAVWCAGYLAFQCFYALPFLYYSELSLDAGKAIPVNALQQAIFNYRVTRDFNTWGGIGFFIWHSGYFSICSWLALIYMSAPRKRFSATK
jgi:heme exporter protein D